MPRHKVSIATYVQRVLSWKNYFSKSLWYQGLNITMGYYTYPLICNWNLIHEIFTNTLPLVLWSHPPTIHTLSMQQITFVRQDIQNFVAVLFYFVSQVKCLFPQWTYHYTSSLPTRFIMSMVAMSVFTKTPWAYRWVDISLVMDNNIIYALVEASLLFLIPTLRSPSTKCTTSRNRARA